MFSPPTPRIFVSYAQVDDQAYESHEQGWVSTLVSNVNKKLAMALGRSELFEVWIDHKLGPRSLVDALKEALDGSHILLLISSHGYLESHWCQSEMALFLEQKFSKRVFRVDRNDVPLTDLPLTLQKVFGVKFWYDAKGVPRIMGDPRPSSEDDPYWNQIDYLCYHLAKEVRNVEKELRAASPTITVTPVYSTLDRPALAGLEPGTEAWREATAKLPLTADKSIVKAETDSLDVKGTRVADVPLAKPPPPPSIDGPVVFLADGVSSDIAAFEIQRFLCTQAGCQLRTAAGIPLRDAGYVAQVTAALSGCRAFVQMLSTQAEPGAPVTDMLPPWPRMQYEAAVNAGIPIFQWLDPVLKVPSVTDPRYAAFLKGAHLRQEPLTAFQQAIKDCLFPPPAPPGRVVSETKGSFVFVNSETPDDEVARYVVQLLEEKGQFVLAPLAGGTAEERLKELQDNLLGCDSMVLICGKTPPWGRQQLLLARSIRPTFLRDLRPLGVVKAPPPKPQGLGFSSSQLVLVNCEDMEFNPGVVDDARLRSAFKPLLDHF